jgi:hypothetical protein
LETVVTPRILAIIAWIVIGFAGGAVIFGELGPLFGFRHMEGSSAIFAVMVGAPLGILAGVVFAVSMLRRFKDDAAKTKRFANYSLLGIVAIVLGGVVFEMIRSRNDLEGVRISFQVRFPPGMTPPAKAEDIKAELRTPARTITPYNYYTSIDRQNGRPYVYNGFDIYSVAPKRVLALRFGDGPTYLFTLRVDPRPKAMKENFSEWYPVDEVDDNLPGKAPRAPLPGERREIRHGVSGGE